MSNNPPPAPHPVIDLPIDPDHGESDSSFGEDTASSTTSLSSSIRDYRQLHGRTYSNFADEDYWGPNDNIQNDQLDIFHQMCLVLLDHKLYRAPIGPNPQVILADVVISSLRDPSIPEKLTKCQKIIDIGTGTGIWAIDIADEFPSAEVVGTDFSPIQPTFVPPNCKFEIDNAELDWTFGVDSVDFVHLRCMIGCISDWPKLYGEAFKALKPGGYIEHLEMSLDMRSDDETVNKDSVIHKWGVTFMAGGDKMGKSTRIFDTIKKDITEAGFVDVTEKIYKVPIGGWSSDPKSKEVGRWNLLQFTQGIEGFALFILSNVLQWEYTESQALIGQMRAAIRDPRIHSYYQMTCVYGRKPGKTDKV